MTKDSSQIIADNNETSVDLDPSCTLYVCTSCRKPGVPRFPKEQRSGFVLYQQLNTAIVNSELRNIVKVRPTECLSICPRPCGIALSNSESWVYLFGDQNPEYGVDDILECLSIYVRSSDGFMARNERPNSLRSSILGRIPPLGDK